jgi:hypothetical protein
MTNDLLVFPASEAYQPANRLNYQEEQFCCLERHFCYPGLGLLLHNPNNIFKFSSRIIATYRMMTRINVYQS